MMKKNNVLLYKPEIFVYKIPSSIQRKHGHRHRAKDWANSNPHWYGHLEVLSGQKSCIVQLEDKHTGLFGQCIIEEYPGIFLQSVKDSTRYFVLRVTLPSGTNELFGIGFTDRLDSDDFVKTLQDYFSKDIKSCVTVPITGTQAAVVEESNITSASDPNCDNDDVLSSQQQEQQQQENNIEESLLHQHSTIVKENLDVSNCKIDDDGNNNNDDTLPSFTITIQTIVPSPPPLLASKRKLEDSTNEEYSIFNEVVNPDISKNDDDESSTENECIKLVEKNEVIENGVKRLRLSSTELVENNIIVNGENNVQVQESSPAPSSEQVEEEMDIPNTDISPKEEPSPNLQEQEISPPNLEESKPEVEEQIDTTDINNSPKEEHSNLMKDNDDSHCHHIESAPPPDLEKSTPEVECSLGVEEQNDDENNRENECIKLVDTTEIINYCAKRVHRASSKLVENTNTVNENVDKQCDESPPPLSEQVEEEMDIPNIDTSPKEDSSPSPDLKELKPENEEECDLDIKEQEIPPPVLVESKPEVEEPMDPPDIDISPKEEPSPPPNLEESKPEPELILDIQEQEISFDLEESKPEVEEPMDPPDIDISPKEEPSPPPNLEESKPEVDNVECALNVQEQEIAPVNINEDIKPEEEIHDFKSKQTHRLFKNNPQLIRAVKTYNLEMLGVKGKHLIKFSELKPQLKNLIINFPYNTPKNRPEKIKPKRRKTVIIVLNAILQSSKDSLENLNMTSLCYLDNNPSSSELKIPQLKNLKILTLSKLPSESSTTPTTSKTKKKAKKKKKKVVTMAPLFPKNLDISTTFSNLNLVNLFLTYDQDSTWQQYFPAESPIYGNFCSVKILRVNGFCTRLWWSKLKILFPSVKSISILSKNVGGWMNMDDMMKNICTNFSLLENFEFLGSGWWLNKQSVGNFNTALTGLAQLICQNLSHRCINWPGNILDMKSHPCLTDLKHLKTLKIRISNGQWGKNCCNNFNLINFISGLFAFKFLPNLQVVISYHQSCPTAPKITAALKPLARYGVNFIHEEHEEE